MQLFFPAKWKISKCFDAALHYKDFFSEHGFDSDQILKYFNEIVKLFIPRKVTIMSLINGYTVSSWSIANNFVIDFYCRCLEILCQIA